MSNTKIKKIINWTSIFFVFSLLFVFFVSLKVVRADTYIYSSTAYSPNSLNWYPSQSGSQLYQSFGYTQDPCPVSSQTSAVQVGYLSGISVEWRLVCSPSAPQPPHLSLSCSASSDSNGVVNLNKVYWAASLNAFDSFGNPVSTSTATYLWKDKGLRNIETMDISVYNGSLASNSVTVSLNGSTATAQCTLPPPPPLYVACYGSAVASSTNWTAISRSYDYYGNPITPNYSWSDAKTGVSESTNGSANSVTANYMDVYGQKSAGITKICTGGTSSSFETPLDQTLDKKYCIKNVCSGSLMVNISKDIKSLSTAAQTDNFETLHLIVSYSDGEMVDYTVSNGVGTVHTDEVKKQANDYAIQNNLTITSVAQLHNHPNIIPVLYGLPTPPSEPDLEDDMSLPATFSKAIIQDYAIDALGNVYQYSVPQNSEFAKSVKTAFVGDTISNGISDDIIVADTPNIISRSGGYQHYLNLVKSSGVIIKNVTSQFH